MADIPDNAVRRDVPLGRSENLIALRDIVKIYGATTAVNHIDFNVRPGEVVGLIGPNGAGKSTLMGILMGVTPATSGAIQIDGVDYPSARYNTTLAMDAGIACAFQEMSLCRNLSVYENFAISLMGHRGMEKPGWRKRLAQIAREALDRFFPNNGVNVYMKVSRLSIEKQQMVEICRAASAKSLKALILDEPTSSLTNDRIQQLHTAIRTLGASGVAIIYISHKLEEIKRISDRIVVLRNGELAWQGQTRETTTDTLVNLMGGKAAAEIGRERVEFADSEPLVEIRDFSSHTLKHIQMTVGKGEIVGVSGLGGSGQRDLLHEIFDTAMGKRHKSITIHGSASFISGDRQKEGIFNLWSIADNILISSLDQLTHWGLLSRQKSDELARRWYDKLKFKAQGKDAPITSLSGGNQQKAIIGRGIASDADLIILDDLTRGVDIETKKEIYAILEEIRNSGKSVVWYSTEDTEMEECDRVYVMSEGAIVAELRGDEVTVDNIIASSFVDTGAAQAQSGHADTQTRRGASSKARDFISSGSTVSGIIFVLIWIAVSFLNKNANTRLGLSFLIGASVPLVFVAMGQMFIVLVGDINLGIGTAMGLINVITATYLIANPLLGVGVMLLFLALYCLIAVLIHVRKMPAIVVSLGMLSVWLGIALCIQPTPGGSAPAWLSAFLKSNTPFVPVQVYICIAVALIGYWIVCRSKYGIILRGIGNNPQAVARHGWSYLLAHVAAYAISGVFVICAGIALTGVSKGADANGAGTYQMMSIATILLGGCAFSGGLVEPIGVVTGALSISLISSMLTFMQVSSNYQRAVIGIILLIALVGGQLLKRGEKA